MEIQQMMERLLAEIRADRKVDQEKADADRTRQEQILKAMQEKADADRKADREQMLAMRQEMNANTKAFKEKTDA
jgi:hypothetical protein